ncbi:MAG: hypothetical protein KAG19_03990 [Methylococcales bacterium]|nr:hypothetical protein [Methylococcales bacterium]
MKRVSIYFLAFLTFWMSTWLVTDIHDWSLADAGQSHPIFSVTQSHIPSDDIHTATTDHKSHCGVCSYDHGGHIGQTLLVFPLVAKSFSTRHTPKYLLQSELWYSRNISPKTRPPIA